MWKKVIQLIIFAAILFGLTYSAIHVVRIQRANNIEIANLQLRLDEDKKMLDELTNESWKLKRDTDYLFVNVWSLWMVKMGLPFNIHPLENLNFPPYADIFIPVSFAREKRDFAFLGRIDQA